VVRRCIFHTLRKPTTILTKIALLFRDRRKNYTADRFVQTYANSIVGRGLNEQHRRKQRGYPKELAPQGAGN
jgi:hypothetical protein